MTHHKLTTELFSSTAPSLTIDAIDLPKDIEGLSSEDLENKWVVLTHLTSDQSKKSFVFDDQIGVIYFVRGVLTAHIQGAKHKVYGVYHRDTPVKITIDDIKTGKVGG